MLIEVSKSGVLCHVSEVQIHTFDDNDDEWWNNAFRSK